MHRRCKASDDPVWGALIPDGELEGSPVLPSNKTNLMWEHGRESLRPMRIGL